jgi:hypothetical protein
MRSWQLSLHLFSIAFPEPDLMRYSFDLAGIVTPSLHARGDHIANGVVELTSALERNLEQLPEER